MESVEREREELARLAGRPALSRWVAYFRKTGPGWLQSAITLGGGSLAGSLYLGVLGGFALLWLQPLAMLLGIVMLSAISYVTLSTGRRPFQAINQQINPVLGWGWAMATLLANIVWCLPQFALGTAAVQQNLFPGLAGPAGKVAIVAVLLLAAGTVVWFYDSGRRGIRIFEIILKIMVAVIVLCFIGVVIRLSLSPAGISWRAVFTGFAPRFSLLFHPPATYDSALAATGAFAEFWRARIVHMQRDVMITATATAVGINMTFLLPYSMLRKGWGKEHRELAVFDLALGLFLPFVLATSCVVIAAADRFHARPDPRVLSGRAPAAITRQYEKLLAARVRAEHPGVHPGKTLEAEIRALPLPDKRMAAMLVKRDAFTLAGALEKLTGRGVARYGFGIGVLGMALSTIIILMLINGFTVCEMLDRPGSIPVRRAGCAIVGLGALGPFVWSGRTQFWLAVPTSVFGMTLLPIAYFTFFLMMNHRGLLGRERPAGRARLLWNLLMLAALTLACIGAGYAVWSKTRWIGAAVAAAFIGTALAVQVARAKSRRTAGPETRR